MERAASHINAPRVCRLYSENVDDRSPQSKEFGFKKLYGDKVAFCYYAFEFETQVEVGV